MKITVFGSGYVGLVQAAVLAEVGHDVVCMDVDQKKVDLLRQGHVSIFEPGLASLVREGLDSKRLQFTTDERLAVFKLGKESATTPMMAPVSPPSGEQRARH